MLNLKDLPSAGIAGFCRKWQIAELALFGSAVRGDFGSESDVDALATFSEGSEWGLLDHVQMQRELEDVFNRKADLISRRALDHTQNQLLRDEILKTAKVIFNQNTYVEG